MNIVIAGDGEVGFHLAKMLSNEYHNITIVDPHQELLRLIESQSDLMTIDGDSTSISVLESANVKKADLFISALHDERTNIVTSILAKKLGAKRIVCRVNNPEYLEEENKKLFESLGIDDLISPEAIASREIIKLLNQTAVTEIFEFSKGKLSLFLLKLDEKALVIDRSLNNIAKDHTHLDFRAVAIHRRGKTIIPKGDDTFKTNDLAYAITRPEGVEQLLALGGKVKIDIRDIMIIGGGRIGRMTAKALEKDLNIKLIEKDKDRCYNLSNSLHNTLIINGDVRDIELLEDEGIRNTDAFIAVTNNSETNILSCILAHKYGVKRTIALVENIDYIDVAQNMGIDTIINKKLITASYIARFTMGAEVTSIKCLNGVDAEVLEFVVKPNSKITKSPIRKLNFPVDAIIGGIVRGNDSYIATGDFQILSGDKVVVFSLPNAIQKVDRFFN